MEELDQLRKLSEQEAMDDKLRREISIALFDAMPDSIVVVDQNGIIFQVNRETELIFGYSRQEIIGQPVEALLPGRLRDSHVSHRAKYLDEPRTRSMGQVGMELYGRRKDGREFAAEISLSPLPTERGLFVITIIRRRRG